MNQDQIEKLHRDTSIRVAGLSRLLPNSPDESDQDRGEEARSQAYTFTKPLRLVDALSYLLAADHLLSGEELHSIMSRIENLPLRWRNAIYRDPRWPDATKCHIFTQSPDGSFTMSENAVLGIPKDTLEAFPRAALTRLLPEDSVVVTPEAENLEVSIQRASRGLVPLALHWWAIDESGDYHGSIARSCDTEMTSTPIAIITNSATRCFFSIIADAT